ncbi:tetratricopeptide repeat protein [Lachnospiraceae bacterium OttesenSCG-928-E19]|nr:tetratricopeptide repeat protein [Lachnospiraceae bacterium OttesenSCG-928-E19]
MKTKKTAPKKVKAKATPVKKKQVAKPAPVAQPAKTKTAAPRFNTWSLSIYVYWFIILFFIGATFYILGRSHGLLKPLPSNIEITEEVLMQSNDYMEAGKVKLVAGEVDAAIEDLTIAVQSENAPVDAYILRGEAYMQAGDYQNAMNDFDNAIQIDPVNSVAFYDRALLFTRLEDYASALGDVNNALAARAVKPNDILQLRDIYAKRGQLNLWLKNWEGAVADFTNSLARPEGVVNPSVYADRAEAYTAMGSYTEATNDYMSAIRVISEQIQGATTDEAREDLSRRALGYFEKSAALNVRMGNMESALSDLESAFTIAVALGDNETVDRLTALIAEIGQ